MPRTILSFTSHSNGYPCPIPLSVLFSSGFSTGISETDIGRRTRLKYCTSSHFFNFALSKLLNKRESVALSSKCLIDSACTSILKHFWITCYILS